MGDGSAIEWTDATCPPSAPQKYSIAAVRLGGVIPSHPFTRADGLGGSRCNMIGLPSRKGRVQSAERVEAHLSASSLRHLLSARCADTGRFDERRSLCRLIRMGRHALFPTVPISAI